MKIVITGATGAIGIALLNKHIELGDKILIIANPNSRRNDRIKQSANIKIIFADLYTYKNIHLDEKYDIFYHLAWQGGNKRYDIEINMKSALASVDAVDLAARIGCKVFIGAGSQAECGRQTTKISHKTICNPETPFGIAKLSSYFLSKFQAELHGLKFSWARILSIYGPFDGEQTLITSTIKKLMKNEPLKFSDGTQVWDFLYADDAANALTDISLKSKDGGIYIIGSGISNKLKEFISKVTSKFGENADNYLGLIPVKENDIKYLVADTSRLTKEFGWKPNINFNIGIDLTIDFLKKTIND